MDFFRIVYDYAFILQLLTVCTSLIIIFYPIKKTWKTAGEVVLQLIILFSAGTLLNWGLFALADVVTPLRGINFPVSWLVLILGYLFFIKSPFVNRILMGSTLFVTVYSIILISRQFMGFFPEELRWMNVFIYIFIILYSILLHRLSLKEYTDLPLKSAIMMFVINACLAVLLIIKEGPGITPNVTKDFATTDWYYIMTLHFFCAISICSYLMLHFYAKTRKSMVQLQVENKLLEADRERIESFETAREDFHLLRHDINNQLNVLQIMLEKKDYDEALKYFDSMYSNFVHSKRYDFIDCGNSVINSVINMEISKAKRYDIDIKSNINISDDLPFEKSDISRILVNLIDNSIEALAKVEEDNKQILCSLLIHGEYLYIGVQNKINKDAKPEKILSMNTDKEDQINHGFGHRIVKKIADKYNGHTNYSVEDGVFFAEVMLDLKYDLKR